MIRIKYNTRTFIKSATKQVAIRVRWENKRYEAYFLPGVYADPQKWDSENQKAMKLTNHIINGREYSASRINGLISEYLQEIRLAFEAFEIENKVPTSNELKMVVDLALEREEVMEKNEQRRQQQKTKVQRKTITELLQNFFEAATRERKWNDIDSAKEKYTQAVNHLLQACPDVTPDNITDETMYQLKEWYIKTRKLRNRTIVKQFTMLIAFLTWVNEQDGYEIPAKALSFSPKLDVIKKNVRFLTFEELQTLASAPMPAYKPHIGLARDLWCFMAYTSLRYSDLAKLKVGHIHNNTITMVTQKTHGRITVQLTEGALAIYNKYKDSPTADGHVFNVPSNQKLNDYIKIAAKRAKLDRMVIDTYLVGTEEKEDQKHLYEVISCHDARRTFVSLSLAMKIPPHIVAKATGHQSYKTMQPYIDANTETQALEMEKWNQNQYRSKIISALDDLSEEQMKALLEYLKNIA